MTMLPVVALVGRPNVGKSTLFNYLTRSRDALVADYPGLTRDRQYGTVRRGGREYLVVDTGGIVEAETGLDARAMRQVDAALEDADLVLFVLDAREGLTAGDEIIAAQLRRTGKPVMLAANKIDLAESATARAEFHALGLGEPHPISAAHARGIQECLEILEARLPSFEPSEPLQEDGIRIAIVGRPNVGKSTLVNRLLGEERVVVFDAPGTTRDSVYVPFERQGRPYTLIDTAGIRRRGRIAEMIEKFSVIKALKAIEQAHVVIYLIDAREGVTDQDTHLLGMVLDMGRGLIVGLNKWDGMTQDQRDETRRRVDLKLGFLDFAKIRFISALHGTGVGTLFDAIEGIHAAAMTQMGTAHLTLLLQKLVTAHQPPLVRGRRIRLKFAHQGGTNPPTIVIHGNQVESIPGSYQRYLVNGFRAALGIEGTPIRLEFKAGENPFEGRKNVLTERQVKKRRRMIRHVKKT